MQPFEEITLNTLIRVAQGEGYSAVLVPVGIYGSYRVLSPDTYKPPTTTIARAMIPGMPRGLIKVTIGSPYVIDQSEPIKGLNFNEQLARRLAKLLPSGARGMYK